MPSYSEDQRAEAIALYVEHGPTEASRRLNIPKGTITRWAKRAGAETVSPANTRAATEAATAKAGQRRAELRQLLLEKALDALRRMDAPHKDYRGKDADEVWWDKAPSGDMKNYATTAAILIDKLRLEEGAATSREEHVQTSEVDRELERLADELRARADAGSPLPVASDS